MAKKSAEMIALCTGQGFSFHFHLSFINCCTKSTKSAFRCTATKMWIRWKEMHSMMSRCITHCPVIDLSFKCNPEKKDLCTGLGPETIQGYSWGCYLLISLLLCYLNVANTYIKVKQVTQYIYWHLLSTAPEKKRKIHVLAAWIVFEHIDQKIAYSINMVMFLIDISPPQLYYPLPFSC